MPVGFPTKVNYATGDVLSATNMNDLSGTVNLLESAQYAAGKNKIINGDFDVNQRNFTTSTGGYGFDRWALSLSGGTSTYTPQTFTLGTAPVAGYESKNFARVATTVGNDLCRLEQKIESVRTFAGQTATVSFWAKGTNPTTAGNLAITLTQFFGTGGSPSTNVILTQQTFVLTANWTRYSFTFAIPSISGKTLGTANDDYLALWIGQGTSVSTDAWTLDLWGVQLEEGVTASPFQTATGTIQGELAACQRYYYRQNGISNTPFGFGMAATTTSFRLSLPYKQSMRVSPSSIDFSGLQVVDTLGGYAVSNLVITAAGTDFADLTATSTGMTAQRAGWINGSGTCYIGLSAEL